MNMSRRPYVTTIYLVLADGGKLAKMTQLTWIETKKMLPLNICNSHLKL